VQLLATTGDGVGLGDETASGEAVGVIDGVGVGARYGIVATQQYVVPGLR
jgi:hypothetical protein